MSKLIFLTNELLSPTKRNVAKLPLEFISFGIAEGQMFTGLRNNGKQVAQLNAMKRTFGNSVVYGAIFLIKDYNFYIRTLDAYHTCSMSTLYKNHNFDLNWRIQTKVTPITFHTLEELSRLMYQEKPNIQVEMYIANPNHPKIKSRLNTTLSRRIIDGIDVQPFIELYRRIQDERKH